EIEQIESIQTMDDREKNIFTTIESYRISNFWQPIDSSQLDDTYCEVDPQMLRDQISSPSSVIRTMPLALDYPNEFHHHIKLTLPEPWTVESSQTRIEGNGIFYQSQVNSTNNEV